MLSISPRPACLAACLLLLTLACSSAPPAPDETVVDETVSLSYVWQPGEVFPLRFDVEFDALVSPRLEDGELEGPTDIGMTMGLDATVEILEQTDDGATWIGLGYDKLQMDMGGMVFDSSQTLDPDDPTAEAFSFVQQIINDLTFRIQLAPNGEVLDVQGIEEMVERFVADLPEEEQEMARQMVEATLESGNYESQLEYYFPRLPVQPVAVGDRWTHRWESEIPMVGESLSIEVLSQLVDIERLDDRRVARVEWRADLEDSPLADLFAGTEIDLDSFTMSTSGEYRFDVDRGRPLSQEITIYASMAAGADDDPEAIQTDMEMNFHVEMGEMGEMDEPGADS